MSELNSAGAWREAASQQELRVRWSGPSQELPPEVREESSRPVRVAFLSPRFAPFVGGAEISLERLIGGLRGRNDVHPLLMTCQTDTFGTLKVGADDVGPGVIRLGCSQALPPADPEARRASARALLACLERHSSDVDVIYLNNHLFLQEPGHVRRLLALRKPIILKLIYCEAFDRLSEVLSLLPRDPDRLRLHCISRELARLAVGHGFSCEQIFFCPNALPDTAFQVTAPPGSRVPEPLPADPSALTLAFVGRFSPQKNLPGVVDIFQQTARLRAASGLKTRLMMIGYAYFPDMEALVDRLRRQDPQIHWLGAVPNGAIAQTLQAADGLLLASHDEGLSNALLEGMAAGLCPIVPHDLSGARDLIHPDGGILFERADVESLAGRLASSSGAELRALGQKSRDRVARYCKLEGVAACHAQLYHALVRPVHHSSASLISSNEEYDNHGTRSELLPSCG